MRGLPVSGIGNADQRNLPVAFAALNNDNDYDNAGRTSAKKQPQGLPTHTGGVVSFSYVPTAKLPYMVFSPSIDQPGRTFGAIQQRQRVGHRVLKRRPRRSAEICRYPALCGDPGVWAAGQNTATNQAGVSTCASAALHLPTGWRAWTSTKPVRRYFAINGQTERHPLRCFMLSIFCKKHPIVKR